MRAGTTPQRLVFRSRIVLLAARGMPSPHVARQLDTSQDTVRLWRRRFAAAGPDALRRDAPGRGRTRQMTAAREQPVWCNKEAEANLIAGRSAAHGPCPRAPPVAGVRRPACRPALASADEDPVGWPRRLAPHRRVVGCVRRCRNLVSIPGRSAASAVQPAVGHHHRRARPVPATGAPRMVQQRGRGSFGCWPVGRSWPVSRAPPVAGVRRPACRPALASADEDPVDWPRRLAPHRRVVGCVRRCRTLVSIPGRSAASAVQADIGHHPRRARPVPATGAPRGGVGGFVRRCGGCVAAAAGSRAVGRLGRGGERVSSARGCASCPNVSPDGPTGPPLLRGGASARGGGAERCAERRCGPGGAVRHAASPVRAAPDRRRVGRRPRAVPAR